MNINIAFVTKTNYKEFEDSYLEKSTKEQASPFHQGDVVVNETNDILDLVLGVINNISGDMRTLSGMVNQDHFRLATDLDTESKKAYSGLLHAIEMDQIAKTSALSFRTSNMTLFYCSNSTMPICTKQIKSTYQMLKALSSSHVSEIDFQLMKELFSSFYLLMNHNFDNPSKLTEEEALVSAYKNSRFPVETVDDLWSFLSDYFG